MKFGFETYIPSLYHNALNIFGHLVNFNIKTISKNSLRSILHYSSTSESHNSAVTRVKIPHWIDNTLSDIKSPETFNPSSSNKSEVLKRIRPFRLNQLSVFNPNPYSLIKPIRKNPVLKHLWRLRVNSKYRHSSPKRLVVNADVIKHIFLHTATTFDAILTTRKDLIDFLFLNPEHRCRFSRVQLVDKYTLQYCLRGTTHSCNIVDAVAEAFIPAEDTQLSPKFVLALDNIKYTQNLGSIIRSSLALDVDLLYYLKGTTDPFNWKISSITGGVQYAIPHRFGEHQDLRKFCKQKNLVPVVAHLEGEPLESLNLSGGGVCLILGNESEGPHPETFKFAKRLEIGFIDAFRVSLCMHPFTNSLNVSIAGAIIIHQLRSQLAAK